jgi:hypothetical protein
MGVFDDIITQYGPGSPAAASPSAAGVFQRIASGATAKGPLDLRPTPYRSAVGTYGPATDAALQKVTTALMGVALPTGMAALGGPGGLSLGNTFMAALTGGVGAMTPPRSDELSQGVIPIGPGGVRRINPEDVRVPVWSGGQSLYPDPAPLSEAEMGHWNDPRYRSLTTGEVGNLPKSGKKPDSGWYADQPVGSGTPEDRFAKR